MSEKHYGPLESEVPERKPVAGPPDIHLEVFRVTEVTLCHFPLFFFLNLFVIE